MSAGSVVDNETAGIINAQRRKHIANFNKNHGVAIVEGKTKIVYTDKDHINDSRALRMADVRDMNNFYSNKLIQAVNKDNKIVLLPLFDLWFKSECRRTYKNVVFKPVAGMTANKIGLPEPDKGALNLYNGMALMPKEGCCDLIIQHIQRIWCNDSQEQFDYVMGWLARMILKPYAMGETTLVLRSGQGTGKNMIVDILVDAFGLHATTATKPQDILGNFNDHLALSVVVFMNEALWGGDKSSEGALKSLITDRFITCEKKYMPKFKVSNCTHLIISTNNDWYAPIDADDRRFVVMDVSEEKKGDTAYFNALKNEIDTGGEAAFIYHLMHHDISKFNHRELPVTQGASKFDNKLRTAVSSDKWWYECLIDGCIYIEEFMDKKIERNNQALDWDTGSVMLTAKELHESYIQFCSKHKQNYPDTDSVLMKKLNILCHGIEDKRIDRVRLKLIPVLSDARAQFEKHMKSEIDW